MMFLVSSNNTENERRGMDYRSIARMHHAHSPSSTGIPGAISRYVILLKNVRVARVFGTFVYDLFQSRHAKFGNCANRGALY